MPYNKKGLSRALQSHYHSMLRAVLTLIISFYHIGAADHNCTFYTSEAWCNSSYNGYHIITKTFVDRCSQPPQALVQIRAPQFTVVHDHVFKEGEAEINVDRWTGVTAHVLIRRETLHGLRVQMDYHVYSLSKGVVYDHMFDISKHNCPALNVVEDGLSHRGKIAIGIVIAVLFFAVVTTSLLLYLKTRRSSNLRKNSLVVNMQIDAVEMPSRPNVHYKNTGECHREPKKNDPNEHTTTNSGKRDKTVDVSRTLPVSKPAADERVPYVC
ncbi:uncharacterized protein LOC100368667 [Saccoglossus kowalevskii]